MLKEEGHGCCPWPFPVPCLPGKGAVLPPLPPLRTGRETFASSGSSLANARGSGRAQALYGFDFTILTRSQRLLAQGKPHQQKLALPSSALLPEVGLPRVRVTRDPSEVCPLSRRVMLPQMRSATRISAVTAKPSLSPTSFTRLPISLPYGRLPSGEEADGLTMFQRNDKRIV